MRVLCTILTLFVFAPAMAEEVDVELYLAVDVSRSMTPAELEIQRRGYAEALRSDDVMQAITGGLIGAVALTYVEWAGRTSQRVVVPWTRISNPAEARAFADRIDTHFEPGMRRTSISGALMHAAESIRVNAFTGLRQVIDVSGDGPNNNGQSVTSARRTVLSQGITINGLPLMTQDGFSSRWHLDDLDAYYVNCVIGGPGAFMIPVHTWAEFAVAVRRKLVLEIAGRTPPPPPARLWTVQNTGATLEGYDCLIGEKIWQRNRPMWDLP